MREIAIVDSARAVAAIMGARSDREVARGLAAAGARQIRNAISRGARA